MGECSTVKAGRILEGISYESSRWMGHLHCAALRGLSQESCLLFSGLSMARAMGEDTDLQGL
jgi:hypothetical protein